MRKRRMVLRAFVMALCLCFVMSVAGISVLEAMHMESHHGDHDCVPAAEKCEICVHIHDAKALFKRLLLIFACSGLLLAGVFGACGMPEQPVLALQGRTPVACKVRMNN